MCGLTGIAQVGKFASYPASDALLQRMTRAVAHRGPDETVLGKYGAVDLGFARLSLVDPEGGGQPLTTEDESLVLIANGEIYNHKELAAGLPTGTRFKTGSDCEVLLHLYRRDGLRFLDQVRGMYSLVMWDRANRNLVFARDRFGIKPLYYHQDAARILFASEIKALFEDSRTPRILDWERALGDQLLSRTPMFEVSPVHSWFRGIEMVPASTIVTFDLDTGVRHEHRYWEFPSYESCGDADEGELVRAYGEILNSSVTECGMADVEVGLFLSGGVDSAAVAALATPRPRTFTALNASTFLNEDAEYGHRIAGHLGLVNHQVLLDAAHVPTVEEWKNHLWLVEAPIAGPESYYKYEMYRYVRLHAPEIKAMLLGVGSDEFNGGYTSAVATGGDWTDFMANVERMALQRDLDQRPDLGAWWNLPGMPLVRADALRELVSSSRTNAYAMYHRWKYRDVQLYNCWHEDRSAAGNGIEARVPFLDHRLVELAAAVPASLRPNLIWNKAILRRALHGLLPEEFLVRPKVPFFYGDGVRYTYRMFARMLAQDDASLVEQALNAPGAKQFLDPDGVRAALRSLVADPGAGNLEFLLHVVNLGLLEQMSASLPAPPVMQPTGPVSQSVAVRDWDTERDALGALVLRPNPPSPNDRVWLPEGTLLLRDGDDADTWYLAVDGKIEYVLDDREAPGWRCFLQALDGSRDIAAALAAAGVAYEAVADLLSESVDEGVLNVDSVPRHCVR